MVLKQPILHTYQWKNLQCVAVDEPYNHVLARLWTSDHYKTARSVAHSVLPYCLVRTGIGGVVAPSPRCERAASHT